MKYLRKKGTHLDDGSVVGTRLVQSHLLLVQREVVRTRLKQVADVELWDLREDCEAQHDQRQTNQQVHWETM